MYYSNDYAKGNDRKIYEAALQGAEAVVISHNYDIKDDKEYGVYTMEQGYKICDTIDEVKDARRGLGSTFTVEIPVYVQRIAREVEYFEDFQKRVQKEHPEGNQL